MPGEIKSSGYHIYGMEKERFIQNRKYHLSHEPEAILYLRTIDERCPIPNCKKWLIAHNPDTGAHVHEHIGRLTDLARTFSVDTDEWTSGQSYACWLVFVENCPDEITPAWQKPPGSEEPMAVAKQMGSCIFGGGGNTDMLKKAYLAGDLQAMGFVGLCSLYGEGPFIEDRDFGMKLFSVLHHSEALLWRAESLRRSGKLFECEHILTMGMFGRDPDHSQHSFLNVYDPMFNPASVVFFVEEILKPKIMIEGETFLSSRHVRASIRTACVTGIGLMIPVAVMEDRMAYHSF